MKMISDDEYVFFNNLKIIHGEAILKSQIALMDALSKETGDTELKAKAEELKKLAEIL